MVSSDMDMPPYEKIYFYLSVHFIEDVGMDFIRSRNVENRIRE